MIQCRRCSSLIPKRFASFPAHPDDKGLCIACLKQNHRSRAAKRGWATRRARVQVSSEPRKLLDELGRAASQFIAEHIDD